MPNWVVDGCTLLVEDADNLTLESLSTLGWETAAKISWISREYTMVSMASQRLVTGMGSIPPVIWRCGDCNTTGNFQTGYCFGCRKHTSSISVDMASVVVTTANEAGDITLVSNGIEGDVKKLSELVIAAFEDELSQMGE